MSAYILATHGGIGFWEMTKAEEGNVNIGVMLENHLHDWWNTGKVDDVVKMQSGLI